MKVIELNRQKYSPASSQQKEEVKKRIAEMRKESEKLIKGKFEFVDAQGGWFDFSFRFFPETPVQTITITHGEMIEVPVILARHLNNVFKKVRMMPKEWDNRSDRGEVTKISRTKFTPATIL